MTSPWPNAAIAAQTPSQDFGPIAPADMAAACRKMGWSSLGFALIFASILVIPIQDAVEFWFPLAPGAPPPEYTIKSALGFCRVVMTIIALALILATYANPHRDRVQKLMYPSKPSKAQRIFAAINFPLLLTAMLGPMFFGDWLEASLGLNAGVQAVMQFAAIIVVSVFLVRPALRLFKLSRHYAAQVRSNSVGSVT